MSVKIDVNALVSVKSNSPTTADDLVKISNKIIKLYPTGVNLSNMINVTIEVLNEIKELYNLKPNEKKDMVVDILCYVVDNTDAGALEKLDSVIKELIPGVIDSLIRVENGELVFEKPNTCLKKFFQKMKKCIGL